MWRALRRLPTEVDVSILAPTRQDPLIAGSEMGIGVGLHPVYNAAQRLYGRRGYVPEAVA